MTDNSTGQVVLSPARRVATIEELVQPGDYTGPHPMVMNGVDFQEVFFLLPIHSGPDRYSRLTVGSGLHGVTEPPWRFRECPDGSLEIRESIGCGGGEGLPRYWHGFLDEGNVWRKLPS